MILTVLQRDDLSGLRFIDTTGIRLVLSADARSRADSNRLELLRPADSVFRVFVICGFAARFAAEALTVWTSSPSWPGSSA